MDFITEIWTVWSQHVAATMATVVATTMAILGAIAVLKATGTEIRQLVSDVWKWGGWVTLARLRRTVVTRYRVRRAKSAMRRYMEDLRLWIPIEVYDSRLRDDPSKSTRAQLDKITPAQPSWLNDYYVVAALESLSREGSVAKAKRYDVYSWPLWKQIGYSFVLAKAEESACEVAETIETNDHCIAYQFTDQCRIESRFVADRVAETLSAKEVVFRTNFILKDTAPPCELCWEKDSRERDIRNLVESIIKNDLASVATQEITGTNGEFQEAVVTACIESQCLAEADPIREVVKQAIDFQRERNALSTSRLQQESLQGEHQELVAALKEYISSQMN